MWGPATAAGPPQLRETWVHRFLCTACDTLITVAPREVGARRLFSLAAIALAFALFGASGQPLREVRARVSPQTRMGATAAAGWSSMARWAKAVREQRLFDVRAAPPDWTVRQLAARVTSTLAASASPPEAMDSLVAAAFRGALAEGLRSR